MWLALSFASAFLLGFYDTAKKSSLKANAVLPVLLLNTLFSTLIFAPALLGPSGSDPGIDSLSRAHVLVALKSVIVLSSWILGYFGLKHLPLTLVGPINATRPVLVLLGAIFIFGERLNALQWAGVILAFVSLFLLSLSSRKENIDFRRNKWIWCVAASALIGACSGLYDRFLMKSLNPVFVQGWYNLYQLVLMGFIVSLLWLPTRRQTTTFHWTWAIPLISIFISAADFCYLKALSDPDAMISVVSLVRRSSVIVSFLCGAVLFREKNLRAKAIDLALILAGMVLIWLGSR